jgi:hypothetical protein
MSDTTKNTLSPRAPEISVRRSTGGGSVTTTVSTPSNESRMKKRWWCSTAESSFAFVGFLYSMFFSRTKATPSSFATARASSHSEMKPSSTNARPMLRPARCCTSAASASRSGVISPSATKMEPVSLYDLRRMFFMGRGRYREGGSRSSP